MKTIKSLFKEHGISLAVLLGLLFLFFAPVFLGQSGFYTGDHRDQHYPWWFYFSDQIKSGVFPAWTSLMTSGFPLMAEGQIGAFYPLNYLFIYLPAPIGYNASILFHFLLGGIFFYIFALSLGMSRKAALFSAILYVFGSSRSGYFYNITSQRVLVWFPLALYFVDQVLRGGLWRYALGLAGCIFCLLVAGYQQYAGYACVFVAIYALLRFFFWDENNLGEPSNRLSKGFRLDVSFILGVLLSLPQTLPFLQLLKVSSRTALAESFAYVGSMNPMGVIALFYPDWDDFMHTELYIGILPLFFVFLACIGPKKATHKIILGLFALSILLALGGYSPLFRLFVKMTGYAGRVPAKFLYFSGTFLALVAGFGLDYLYRHAKGSRERILKKVKIFQIVCGVVVALMLGSALLLRVLKGQVLSLGEYLVNRLIIGNPVHPHSDEYYYEKLLNYYDALLHRINPFHFYTMLFTLIIIAVIFITPFLVRHYKSRYLYAGIILFVSLDLFAYAQHGVLGNVTENVFIEKPSAVREEIKQQDGFFRTFSFTEDGIYDAFPLYPNFNMIHGLRDAGGYSPLLTSSYIGLMKNLGSLNNSLVTMRGTEQGLKDDFHILNVLGVRYVIAQKALLHPSLVLWKQEGDIYVYENKTALKGAYWVDASEIDSTAPLRIRLEELGYRHEVPIEAFEMGENKITVALEPESSGYLLVTSSCYPGWQAWVGKKRVETACANDLFMAIPVDAGEQIVHFQFSWLRGLLD